MRTIAKQDFKNNLSKWLRFNKPILITHQGGKLGVYYPFGISDMPEDIRRAVFEAMTSSKLAKRD